MPTAVDTLRAQFFEYLFGQQDGWVCIASTPALNDKTKFRQTFFEWPSKKRELLAYIEQIQTNNNVWFGVNLFSRSERKKEYALPSTIVWADLDECHPRDVYPEPSVIIESSPGRFQALWRVESPIDALQAEDYSKRIAYKYQEQGADLSGWDLTQLLRVPFTYNYKPEYSPTPQIDLLQAKETYTDLEDLRQLPVPIGEMDLGEVLGGMPDASELPDYQQVLYKYHIQLKRTAFGELFTTEPASDWSAALWRLINICFEVGMESDEVFAISIEAACNKYIRDKRPISHLWREVKRAEASQIAIRQIEGTFKPLTMPELVTAEEIATIPRSFFDDYRDWAIKSTDAVECYHELTAFVLVSSLVAAHIKLNTSYGPMIPNLWGLVLGDSTLTRKTTAMRMGMDLLIEIDRDILLATDGSVEGLLSGLATRPRMTSVFYKDEVTGFVDSMNRKDYLAGMPETLTQLYDVPEFYTRRLRKEVISITSPVFIFFGGGIRDKFYNVISDQYVLSGFLPRFLVVSGDADLKKIRATGPATAIGTDERTTIRESLAHKYMAYCRMADITIGGQVISQPSVTEVFLTTEAWEKYAEVEMKMVEAASDSPLSMVALPTFERLSRSLLKMVCLIAAMRQDPIEGTIQADLTDVISASRYIQDWGQYSIDLIEKAGRTTTQRAMEKILGAIERKPGIPRSKLMQSYHLTKREMDDIQGTLEDRGQIRVDRNGRGTSYYAIGPGIDMVRTS